MKKNIFFIMLAMVTAQRSYGVESSEESKNNRGFQYTPQPPDPFNASTEQDLNDLLKTTYDEKVRCQKEKQDCENHIKHLKKQIEGFENQRENFKNQIEKSDSILERIEIEKKNRIAPHSVIQWFVSPTYGFLLGDKVFTYMAAKNTPPQEVDAYTKDLIAAIEASSMCTKSEIDRMKKEGIFYSKSDVIARLLKVDNARDDKHRQAHDFQHFLQLKADEKAEQDEIAKKKDALYKIETAELINEWFSNDTKNDSENEYHEQEWYGSEDDEEITKESTKERMLKAYILKQCEEDEGIKIPTEGYTKDPYACIKGDRGINLKALFDAEQGAHINFFNGKRGAAWNNKVTKFIKAINLEAYITRLGFKIIT